jgi:hypothetical protein
MKVLNLKGLGNEWNIFLTSKVKQCPKKIGKMLHMLHPFIMHQYIGATNKKKQKKEKTEQDKNRKNQQNPNTGAACSNFFAY